MFELTSFERKALVFLVGVIFVGAVLQYCLRNQSFNKAFFQKISHAGNAPTTASPQKINLNTASREALTALPGIGPALAGRIVEYRIQHGPFQNIEGLTQVKGIGPALLQRLAPYCDPLVFKK